MSRAVLKPCALLLSGIAAVGWSVPGLAAEMDAPAALVEALRLAAPKTNDPSLYTDWKMRAGAISSWTKRCVGVEVPAEELNANPVMARDTVRCVMGPILAEQRNLAEGNEDMAVRRAASWWMTGDPGQYQAVELTAYLDRLINAYWSLRAAP
jgi:hypothetical protein